MFSSVVHSIYSPRSIQRVNQAKRDTSHDSALVETVDLSKGIGHAKVHRAFLDPLGAHLVLSLKPTDPEAQPDLLYLNRNDFIKLNYGNGSSFRFSLSRNWHSTFSCGLINNKIIYLQEVHTT